MIKLKRLMIGVSLLGVLFFPLHLSMAYNFMKYSPAEEAAFNGIEYNPVTSKPIKWGSETITYYLDPGKLGFLTNEQAHTLLKAMMRQWESVFRDGVGPRFVFGGYLPEDVNGDNYQKYLSANPCYSESLENCESESQKNLQTVIIFDDDYRIIGNEKLCPAGVSCAGVTYASVYKGNAQHYTEILQSTMILGGFVNTDYRISSLGGLMLHELGHLLGLAHDEANQQVLVENLSTQKYLLPTMMQGTSSTTDKFTVSLNPDDKAGLIALYATDPTETGTAKIKGNVFKADGTPMMHVNVIARNIEDPTCEVYTFLSGRTCPDQEFCEGQDLIYQDSRYEIGGLPPGSYTLEVEEVFGNLGAPISPGLYDATLKGDAEFWNENDKANESNTLSSVITLEAGETLDNINFVTSASASSDDSHNVWSVTHDEFLPSLPWSTFVAGPETLCPKEPSVDYAALIGYTETNISDTGSNTTTGSSAAAGGCSLNPNVH